MKAITNGPDASRYVIYGVSSKEFRLDAKFWAANSDDVNVARMFYQDFMRDPECRFIDLYYRGKLVQSIRKPELTVTTERLGRIMALFEAYMDIRRNSPPHGPQGSKAIDYERIQGALADETGYLLSKITHMTLNEYQAAAYSTAIYPKQYAFDYLAEKLASEAGEVAGKVAKRLRDDDGLMTENRREQLYYELGDVLWYVAVLGKELGYSLEDIAEGNIDKLADRKARDTLKGDGDDR